EYRIDAVAPSEGISRSQTVLVVVAHHFLGFPGVPDLGAESLQPSAEARLPLAHPRRHAIHHAREAPDGVGALGERPQLAGLVGARLYRARRGGHDAKGTHQVPLLIPETLLGQGR